MGTKVRTSRSTGVFVFRTGDPGNHFFAIRQLLKRLKGNAVVRGETVHIGGTGPPSHREDAIRQIGAETDEEIAFRRGVG